MKIRMGFVGRGVLDLCREQDQTRRTDNPVVANFGQTSVGKARGGSGFRKSVSGNRMRGQAGHQGERRGGLVFRRDAGSDRAAINACDDDGGGTRPRPVGIRYHNGIARMAVYGAAIRPIAGKLTGQ